MAADGGAGQAARMGSPVTRSALVATALVLTSAGVAAEPRAHDGRRVDTVVAPSYFHGVHGLAVAPNGDVYAGDILGQTVWRIPAGTATPEPFVAAPLGMADDVAIAPDGSLAWTAIVTGVLYEQRPGSPVRALATGLRGINSVGYAPDGRLFAAQIEGVNRLLEIDRDSGAARVVLADSGGLNGFQIDARGTMYAPQGTLQRIVRIDLATAAVHVLATGFKWPTGVDLGPDGTPYVVDLDAGTVSRIGPDGAVRRLAQLLPGIDNLEVDRDGTLLVSSPGDNSIDRVDPDTGAVTRWIAGRLAVPSGVAVTGDGRVLVADTFGLKTFDPRSGALAEIGRRIGEPLRTATSVRACAGRIAAAHWYAARVVVFDGATLAPLGEHGALSLPQDAIPLPNGDVLVAEAGRKCLARIRSRDGKVEQVVSVAGTPVGLTCADARGRVAYTNASSGTVVEVDVATGRTRTIASGLRRPEGISRAPHGGYYVAEVDARRIVEIDASGRVTSLIDDWYPSLDPPPRASAPWIATGLDVARDGTIYVASPATTGLYALRPAASGEHR